MIRAKDPNDAHNNSAGYSDPTAYTAIRNAEKYQNHLNQKASDLVKIIKEMANTAGFTVQGRIALEHKKSGKQFK